MGLGSFGRTHFRMHCWHSIRVSNADCVREWLTREVGLRSRLDFRMISVAKAGTLMTVASNYRINHRSAQISGY